MTIRVGVAGWDYRDWRGLAYAHPRPAGFDPVRHLAGFVDLIEINSSFYGPPSPKVSRGWAKRVGDVADFRYTAKLWRRFTHERDRPWTRGEARTVRDGLLPLLRVHGRNYQDWFRRDAGRDARYDYLYPPEELAFTEVPEVAAA